MRHSLLVLLISLLLLLPTATAAAQDGAPPPALCGDLAAEDCALLTASAEAMKSVPASRLDGAMTVHVGGFPEMQVDPVDMTLEMAGVFLFDEKAMAASAAMNERYRLDPAAALSLSAEELQQLTLDLYAGLDYDLQLRLVLPEAVAAAIGQEGDMTFPTDLSVALRMVDGMVYVDISDFRPMAPELNQLKADWIGFDLVGLLEMSMEEAPAADADAFAVSAAAGAAMVQLMTQLEEYVTVERLDDVALDGQEGAVFLTSPDFAGLMGSDEFREVLMQVMAASATGEESPSLEEIEQGLEMMGLMAPVLFRDLKLESTSVIGLEDRYLYGTTLNFEWDMAGLMQMAAMSDESLRGAVAAGLSPMFQFTVEAAYGGYGETLEVAAPEDVEIIPLDQLQPGDTSAVF